MAVSCDQWRQGHVNQVIRISRDHNNNIGTLISQRTHTWINIPSILYFVDITIWLLTMAIWLYGNNDYGYGYMAIVAMAMAIWQQT
jgi:hypothetical protein